MVVTIKLTVSVLWLCACAVAETSTDVLSSSSSTTTTTTTVMSSESRNVQTTSTASLTISHNTNTEDVINITLKTQASTESIPANHRATEGDITLTSSGSDAVTSKDHLTSEVSRTASSASTVTSSGSNAATSGDRSASEPSRTMSPATTTPPIDAEPESSKRLPSWAYVLIGFLIMVTSVPIICCVATTCRTRNLKKLNDRDTEPKRPMNDSLNALRANKPGYGPQHIAIANPYVRGPLTTVSTGILPSTERPHHAYDASNPGRFSLADFYHFTQTPYKSLAASAVSNADPTGISRVIIK